MPVEIGGNKLIIMLAYVPSRFNKMQFVGELDKQLENLSQFEIPIILAGDFHNDDSRNENINVQQSYVFSITAKGFELVKKLQLELMIPLEHV